MKFPCYLVFLILLSEAAIAQKRFDVTITLDSNIIPQNVRYQYYDGRQKFFLPESVGNKRVVSINEEYFSQYASLHFSYDDLEGKSYNGDFFLTDKPAVINIKIKKSDKPELEYSLIKNAVSIYDTSANKVWARLRAFMIDSSMTKENLAFDRFLKENRGYSRSDSLKSVFNKFYKSRLNRAMLFIKQNQEEYFSKWYFIDQVAQPFGILKNDKEYLGDQLQFIKSVFPPSFIQCVEGRALLDKYEFALIPLELKSIAPAFAIETIDGNKITLRDLKGKFVLLDFWATWCPPCLAQIPAIKEIREKYPLDQLEIIGVSADHNFKVLNTVVKEKEMVWPIFFDNKKEMSNMYKVSLYPTLILIDKEGNVVYKGGNSGNEKKIIISLIDGKTE